MADILYVVDGYVTLGYVKATRVASTSISTQATGLKNFSLHKTSNL